MQRSSSSAPQGKHRQRSTRRLMVVLITVVMVGVLLAGLYFWRLSRLSQNAGWEQQPLPVEAIQLQPTAVPNHLPAVAELRAVQAVTLTAESAGRITAIQFQAGAKVETDTPLLQLFDEPLQAQLQDDLAQLSFANAQYERAKTLTPLGAQSKEMLNQRQAEYQQAQARLQGTRAALRQKRVLAPFAGQLGIRQVNLGQYVNPGQPIVTLTDLSRLYVEFSLPQQALAQLQPGMQVSLRSDAYPQQRFSAKINVVEPQLDRDTRNILVQAEFDNQQGLLRPGMYVAASLNLPDQKNALLLPMTAIQTSAQGNSVVVVRGEQASKTGQAEIVTVQVGRQIGSQVIIEQGLQAGDVVVVNGQNRIQPQAPLRVKTLHQAAVIGEGEL